MIIYSDILQGSEEWHKLRMGKMTASHAQAIASAGKGLETYCRQIAAEIFTGAQPESFKNEDMIRGNEEECFARMIYTMETGNEVDIIGFAQFSDYVGCSPDGVIRTNGGVEFKRKTFNKHNDLLLGAEDFESKHEWQCHMNMLIIDAKWWDLSSYNPSFKGRSLFTKRILRDPQKDKQLLAGFKKGEELIKEYLSRY